MDEKLEASTSEKEPVEAGVSPANSQIAADTTAATAMARVLDLNELQERSGEELESLIKEVLDQPPEVIAQARKILGN